MRDGRIYAEVSDRQTPLVNRLRVQAVIERVTGQERIAKLLEEAATEIDELIISRNELAEIVGIRG